MQAAKQCRVPVVQWFLEPKGDMAHSNRVIAEKLGSPDVRTMTMKDEAGKTRDVWSCDLKEAGELWKSRVTLGIEFDLWGRNRNYGPIVFKTFLLRS